MDLQVEEIVLRPARQDGGGDGPHFLRSSNDDNTRELQNRHVFIRLLKPSNKMNLYKSLILWVVLFGCLFILAGPLALELSYALPSVKSRTISAHLFSEERARDYYPNLIQHGPRVSNTQADYLTRDFLISQLQRIHSTAKMPIQFELSLQNFTADNVGPLQNIAVRLSNPTSQPNTPCLMLTAHYDSVEFSPGGSDDGSGVVILLEILSNLVNDPTMTFSQVHLIVLFTTAEEMNLQGAEAFIREHDWKMSIRRFINLDSTGGNEKAILFRVKPSQLITDYARVPRPHANVIGDEILELTGSDTDYSVFTAKGSLLGYDFAFYLDGYNYHTLNDRPSIVERGALQHLGENILVLSREILLNRVNLQQPESIIDDDRMIYFDVLGRHLIVYKQTTSTIIQSILIGLIIVIGIFVIVFDHLWQRRNPLSDDFSSVYTHFNYAIVVRIVSILVFFICYLLSLIIGLLLSVAIAFLMSKIRPLSWFGNSTLAFFLFGLPCLIGIIASEALWALGYRWCLSKCPSTDSARMKTVDIDQINRRSFDFERHWSLLLIYTFFMIISIYLEYRSLYIILLWSIFVCPIYLLLILAEFGLRWNHKKLSRFFGEEHWYWIFVPYIVSLVPLIHSFEMTSRIVRLAMPMLGRMFEPLPIPADVVISVIVAVPAVLFFLLFIPNLQRTMYFGRTFILLSVTFLIVFIIACTRQPFTSTHPKIVVVRHNSESLFRIENPNRFPSIVPLEKRSSTITLTSHDNMALSPILDEFSIKTGLPLNNRHCTHATKCTFDDTFNRTIAMKEVELTSKMNNTNYRLTFHHVPSYQIGVSSMTAAKITVQNSSIKPRTTTIVDVQSFSLARSFDVTLTIERCNLTDSPFLEFLTRTMPNVVMWGSGRCRTIVDSITLIVVY